MIDPYLALQDAYRAVKQAKPGDRSSLDRHYAITMTDLEKIIAYFKTWCIGQEEPPGDPPASESKLVRVD